MVNDIREEKRWSIVMSKKCLIFNVVRLLERWFKTVLMADNSKVRRFREEKVNPTKGFTIDSKLFKLVQ
jgi:hypothetical protein